MILPDEQHRLKEEKDPYRSWSFYSAGKPPIAPGPYRYQYDEPAIFPRLD
jgi:hypothetical protein